MGAVSDGVEKGGGYDTSSVQEFLLVRNKRNWILLVNDLVSHCRMEFLYQI